MRVWCDNKSAINIAYNPVQHDRTKHVEIDHFFIKEKLDSGIIKLRYVNSGGQVAGCSSGIIKQTSLQILFRATHLIRT